MLPIIEGASENYLYFSASTRLYSVVLGKRHFILEWLRALCAIISKLFRN